MVAEIFYPPLGFGNAATKNVGTTAGTVAAGDAVVAAQAAAVALAAADATAKAAAAQAAAIAAAAADATAKTVGKANTSDLLGVAQDTLTALAGKLDKTGDASGASVTENASAATGTLAKALAGKASAAFGQMERLTLSAASRTAHSPTGNPTAGGLLDTYGALILQGTTAQAANREFMASFGLTSSTGADQPDAPGNGDKVPLYAAMVQQAGSGNAWSYNTLLVRQAGVTKSSTGYEIDFNNMDQHLGEALGSAGSSARPFGVPLIITGVGSYRSTAAIQISGPGTYLFNRGIVFDQNSVKQAAFQDNTVSDISIDIRGGHQYPIDLANSGAVLGAIRLALGTNIVSGKPDAAGARVDGNNVNVIGTDASGNVFLAKGGAAFTLSGQTLIPQSTTQDLGASSSPWRNTWTKGLILNIGGPASSTAAGVAGQVQIDANYIYVCVAANTWKRAALTTW